MYQNIAFLTVQLQHGYGRIMFLTFWWFDDVFTFITHQLFSLHRSIQNPLDGSSTRIYIWLQSGIYIWYLEEAEVRAHSCVRCLGPLLRIRRFLRRKPGNGSGPPLPDPVPGLLLPSEAVSSSLSSGALWVDGWLSPEEGDDGSSVTGADSGEAVVRSAHSCLCAPSTLWRRLLPVWPAFSFNSGSSSSSISKEIS